MKQATEEQVIEFLKSMESWPDTKRLDFLLKHTDRSCMNYSVKYTLKNYKLSEHV